MKIQSWLIASVLGAVMLVSPRAFADYVCSVQFYPGTANDASNPPPRLRVTYTTDSGCAGTFRTVTYCEKSPYSSNFCTNLTSYRYSAAQLMSFYQNLIMATMNQSPIAYSLTSCGGGSTASTCGGDVTFQTWR